MYRKLFPSKNASSPECSLLILLLRLINVASLPQVEEGKAVTRFPRFIVLLAPVGAASSGGGNTKGAAERSSWDEAGFAVVFVCWTEGFIKSCSRCLFGLVVSEDKHAKGRQGAGLLLLLKYCDGINWSVLMLSAMSARRVGT